MEITPKQYLQAIIAIMSEKGRESVSFDPRAYDDSLTKDELPWCRKADAIIDSIGIQPPYGPAVVKDIITITVWKDGEYLIRIFDGTEDENWDHLFHDVYDELWDGNYDEEADDWLARYIRETTCPEGIKKHLVEVIERWAPSRPVRATRPWTDGQGFTYGLLKRVKWLGGGLFLTDEANGPYNQTVCPLGNLTASALLSLTRDIALTVVNDQLRDYDRFAGKPEIADWAQDAVEAQTLVKEAWRRSVKETACMGIHDALTRLVGEREAYTVAFDANEGLLPHYLTVDSFLGHTVEKVTNIDRIDFKRTSDGDFTGEVWSGDEKTTGMLVRRTSVRMDWDESMNQACILPEESILLIEERINDIKTTEQ